MLNFVLAATFGVLVNSMGSDGLTMFINLPEANQIKILAQLMYGHGYVGPFALEYQKDLPTCGLSAYEHVSIVTAIHVYGVHSLNIIYTIYVV